ncbi:MAG: aspartate/glutamate racemase family protein [Desulfobacterales bacterium]|nr:aspartate/glutamate racemase family protein [Desulfobacterales bacterium]
MLYTTKKGRVSSGEAIGILLLDTAVPFIPGDVANATTYGYPVRFQKVEGFSVARALDKDPGVYDALKSAADSLVAQGVRAVTGDCGFMAVHQRRLSEELRVPVFLSSLIQIPFILAMIGEGAKVGVVTADSTRLDDALLQEIGTADPGRVAVAGLQDCPSFYPFAIEETGTLDAEAVEAEVVAAAEELVARETSVRAMLLECSLLPPYAASVQEAVGLPVFDYVTMIDYVFSAVVRRRFSGFM